MSNSQDFMSKLNLEIGERIEIMESSDYEGVPRFQKKDMVLSVAIIIVCTIFLVYVYQFMC